MDFDREVGNGETLIQSPLKENLSRGGSSETAVNPTLRSSPMGRICGWVQKTSEVKPTTAIVRNTFSLQDVSVPLF